MPLRPVLKFALLLALLPTAALAQSRTYTGFDINLYPGDDALPTLHQSFAFMGYWLNNPPGEASNNWHGKRAVIAQQGFGFLVLFNGPLDAQFNKLNPEAAARKDAAAAIAAARHEHFPAHTIIFLDLEEGGRMLPRTARYLDAWAAAFAPAHYRTGVYCSGFEVDDSPGTTISTADDIHQRHPNLALWLAEDSCPPSPGCTLDTSSLQLAQSGRSDALVWQYAQSPRRRALTAACAGTYSGNQCYVPGAPHTAQYAVDLDLAATADPSSGR